MTKADLRKSYLAKQKALTADERYEASNLIATNFFGSFSLDSVRTLHCFLPIEHFKEIDTTPIIHKLWIHYPQVRTVVPRVNFESGEMESVRYTAESETDRNRWLIPEPLEGEIIAPAAIDMVLLPGLCYDLHGNRVGYGKGFYDRFLSECRGDCKKLGLSYFDPIAQIDDVYHGDVTVDFVLTSREVVAFDKTV